MNLVHRLLSSPLSHSVFKREESTIIHLARVNNISIDIPSLIRKKYNSKILNSTTTHVKKRKREKWIRLPYIGELTSLVSKITCKHHLRPAFYSVNNVKNLFPEIKNTVPTLKKSNDCQSVYVGQTGRELRVRVSEHKNHKNLCVALISVNSVPPWARSAYSTR